MSEIVRLNGRCNRDEFRFMVEAEDIRSAKPQGYVKMVGGNVHLAASPIEDEHEARKASRKVMSRLAQHLTSVSLVRIIPDGMITVRWVYRCHVDRPSDYITQTERRGEKFQVTSSVAGVGRLALRLPRKTLCAFMFGAVDKGRLIVPPPGDKPWISAAIELWKVAHSPNGMA